MSEPIVLFPAPKVFVIRPTIRTVPIILILALIATTAIHNAIDDPGLLVVMPSLLGLLSIGARALERKLAFNKTRYEIYSDRIIHKTGSILSERTTNLPFRNVTQIGLTLPFLEHSFYKTGHLTVHAAGSSSSRVHLTSIADSKEIYHLLEERLRQNGFSIERTELVQKERPGLIGVFLDGKSMGRILGVIFAPLMLIPAFNDVGLNWLLAGAFVLPITFIALLAVFTRSVLSFIDRKERVYTLWDDCIEYEDGFMTRRHKLIPFENLADTNAEQTFLKRLFGMADLVISCQGTSGNIYFPSMPRAHEFRQNLDRLLSQVEKTAPASAAERSTPPLPSARTSPPTEDLTRPNITPRFRLPTLGDPNRPGQTYRIHPLRLAAPHLASIPFLLLALPLIIRLNTLLELEIPFLSQGLSKAALAFTSLIIGATAIHVLLVWFAQTLTIGPRSISLTLELISEKKTTEFTNDKITSITVHRSFFDHLFGTASLSFFSIGAATPIHARALPDYPALQQQLEEIFQLPAQTPHSRIIPTPTLSSAFLTNLPFFFAMSLVAAGLIISSFFLPLPRPIAIGGAILAIGAGMLNFVYELIYYRKARLSLFEHHLMVQTGIINHKFCYIAYHDIKNISALKYPGHNLGALTIEAGGAGSRATIEHIAAPFALQDRLDAVLYTRPMRDVAQTETFDTDELATWTPDAKNDLIQNTLLCALTVVAIPLIPLVLLYTTALYRRAEDILQIDRVCTRRGLFFQRRNTVLINRIDQIQTRRGALHNLCKNGVIEIYTVGSGQAEATLGPHENFHAVYDAVQRRAA